MVQIEHMRNRKMAERITAAEAVSVHAKETTDDGHYILEEEFFQENQDGEFCNAETESWIQSIGRRLSDGIILASHTPEFYDNPMFECLWIKSGRKYQSL